MKSIKVTIYGRQYPLKVDNEDIDMMYDIADYVNKRLRTFKDELINQSESTIMIMTCLSLAEELFALRRKYNATVGSDQIFDHVNDKLSKLLTDIKQQNSDII
ncbi:MAG TPA: cell division protein ZapA [Balneolales bacterium]|nr:cell division protein ZapA [Balneolales bacterium]